MALGVDTVVIAGVSTSGCIRASATDAMQHGFRPLVVADACADRTQELHRSNLRDLGAKYADVIAAPRCWKGSRRADPLAPQTTGYQQEMTDTAIFDTAIFDVDGTLVDSNYQHALAWFRAFRRHDITLPLWRLHRGIGMGGDLFVAHVAGEAVEDEARATSCARSGSTSSTP